MFEKIKECIKFNSKIQLDPEEQSMAEQSNSLINASCTDGIYRFNAEAIFRGAHRIQNAISMASYLAYILTLWLVGIGIVNAILSIIIIIKG